MSQSSGDQSIAAIATAARAATARMVAPDQRGHRSHGATSMTANRARSCHVLMADQHTGCIGASTTPMVIGLEPEADDLWVACPRGLGHSIATRPVRIPIADAISEGNEV